jgi:pimeloyl-ACP methyl ester carboxylesterase
VLPSMPAARSKMSSRPGASTSSGSWMPAPTSGSPSNPRPVRTASPTSHEDYVSAYDLGRFAESARFVRHYPEQNAVLRGLLPSITTPAQIIAGRDDDLVPWSNNEYLADLLPNSEIHPLDAGHFAWEQASDEYGRLIVDWVTGGFQRLGGAVTA